MNRHHPYGANFDHSSPGRRGNHSPAPPGDRGHRYPDRGGPPFRARGGGFQRGRGGYGHYDQGMSNQGAYDQGPSQNDFGGYNNYEPPPPNHQQSYYQNSYADSTPAHFPPSTGQSGYQDYSKFADGPGTYDEEDRNRRPIRKERDDKYETPSEDVRRIFEEHGEIKTFFDLISTRGMVFVTYFDLRAAERARERLQGSEISGRPIDVHYSLPRDDQKGNDREKNQQFQGTLQVTLRNSVSGLPIDDNEVRRKFQQFGDVKAVKPVGDRIDSRYVEFYDTRACGEAHDRLRHQGLQDGVMDIVFAWDETISAGHREGGGGGGHWEDRGGMRGGMRGGRGGNRGAHRGGRGRGEDYDDRRGDFGRQDRDYRQRNGRYDDENPGRGGRQGGYNDRYENNRGGYGGPPPPPPQSGGYGAPPISGYGGGPPGYGMPPAPPPPPPSAQDDRLEQARKVQQLLAALKQPVSAPPAVPPPTSAPPMPAIPAAPPTSNSYYSQPPAQYPGPANPYGAPNAPPASVPPVNPNLANLPPNILALLQSAQQQSQQRPPPPGQAFSAPPPHLMGTPPPGAMAGAPPSSTNPQYQQLMAYLQTQATAQVPKP
uniref:RRM domain-containing protein n=1 Tax=Psilocybe cubensis TaxID=181762 RepID=A0A8H7YAD6_PSICU